MNMATSYLCVITYSAHLRMISIRIPDTLKVIYKISLVCYPLFILFYKETIRYEMRTTVSRSDFSQN